MKLRGLITLTGGAAALLGLVMLGAPAAWAQDATPVPAAELLARPAHVHSGNCVELGEVVQPLTDLTAPRGDRVGQARRAASTENSYTSVPMSLEAMLSSDHAINVHLSADEIGTYIACGEIGGVLLPDGSLIIGLRELNTSGFSGIAFLAPEAGGASTGVSVFIAQDGGRGGN